MIRLAKSLGIDWAIAYTLFARGIQALGGICTVLVIAQYLSNDEQGYYYTFGSILALQVFFEMGLNSIITQYVAHEMAHLTWKDIHHISGDESYRSRLASLLHLFTRWMSLIAMVFLAALLLAGFYFFSTYNSTLSHIKWQGPWILLSFTTTAFLLLNPIMAFLEGLGKVKEIARMRLIQQTIYLAFVIIFLISGFKLYSSALASFIGMICIVCQLLLSSNLKILKNIWKQSGEEKISYRKEIFPYQWKIALSWISGYFIFQLFNPVLFVSEGAVSAGQMGMTLAALNGVIGLSMSWINTKIPLFSALISKQDYNGLDKLFFISYKQSLFMMGSGLVILFISVLSLQYYEYAAGRRFLSAIPLACISISYFLNAVAFGLAIYLRCHKAEPLLIQSIVFAILTSISTVIFGNYYGVLGITLGYLMLGISVGLPWILVVFYKKRRLWHQRI